MDGRVPGAIQFALGQSSGCSYLIGNSGGTILQSEGATTTSIEFQGIVRRNPKETTWSAVLPPIPPIPPVHTVYFVKEDVETETLAVASLHDNGEHHLTLIPLLHFESPIAPSTTIINVHEPVVDILPGTDSTWFMVETQSKLYQYRIGTETLTVLAPLLPRRQPARQPPRPLPPSPPSSLLPLPPITAQQWVQDGKALEVLLVDGRIVVLQPGPVQNCTSDPLSQHPRGFCVTWSPPTTGGSLAPTGYVVEVGLGLGSTGSTGSIGSTVFRTTTQDCYAYINDLAPDTLYHCVVTAVTAVTDVTDVTDTSGAGISVNTPLHSLPTAITVRTRLLPRLPISDVGDESASEFYAGSEILALPSPPHLQRVQNTVHISWTTPVEQHRISHYTVAVLCRPLKMSHTTLLKETYQVTDHFMTIPSYFPNAVYEVRVAAVDAVTALHGPPSTAYLVNGQFSDKEETQQLWYIVKLPHLSN